MEKKACLEYAGIKLPLFWECDCTLPIISFLLFQADAALVRSLFLKDERVEE